MQKANGELLWEGGDNRRVAVPEDAPAGSMIVADCCFNYADQMAQPELQPLSEDVLAMLEQQAEEALAAQLQAAAGGNGTAAVLDAASAVAKALATLGEPPVVWVKQTYKHTAFKTPQGSVYPKVVCTPSKCVPRGDLP